MSHWHKGLYFYVASLACSVLVFVTPWGIAFFCLQAACGVGMAWFFIKDLK